MLSPIRMRAEEKFGKIKQQDKKVLKDREKEQQEVADKISRLRALRLAKEVSDKEAADRESADKAAAKAKAPAKPVKAARRKPVTAKKAKQATLDSDDSDAD
ncbi:MAG: hypothetical protein WEC41_07355 [Dongiaceae bacterium]